MQAGPDGNSLSAAAMPTTRSAGCSTGDESTGPPLSCAGLPSCARITEPMRTPLSWASVKDASTSLGSD